MQGAPVLSPLVRCSFFFFFDPCERFVTVVTRSALIIVNIIIGMHLFCLTVPPAYYAHLAAFRARFYIEAEMSDSCSLASGAAGRGASGGGSGGAQSTRVSPGASVRPLPTLKDNVKKVMFYC